MKKGIDVKLNVRPIYIGLIHQHVFEGPCRFGGGEELTTEFDVMMNKELNKDFVNDVTKNLSIKEVNLLAPIYVERYEDFLSPESMFEAMAKDVADVDLYVVGLEIARGDIVVEFANRTKKPIAIVPENCCMIGDCVPPMRTRGLEAYGYLSWGDAIRHIKALRVRKVLKNTNVLLAPRMNSNNSMASDATFYSLNQVTDELGPRFRYVSAHEVLDQTHVNDDPTCNHCTPGRKENNITTKELKEIEKITDDLIKDAKVCAMTRENLLLSVKAWYTVKKLLDIHECNAYSMPCPDVCASRRLNEEKITFCLCHSLNNELGIPSACEYDVSALIAMQILLNFSGTAAYMGNTNPIMYKDGVAQSRRVVTDKDLEKIKNEPNLYFTFHSTPNRKLKGLDKPNAEYSIQSFARSGFGGTLRYDFAKDSGQVITMCRFSPDCKKLFIGKGVIKGSCGYDEQNCSMGVIFQVGDQSEFFNKQINFGNHLPLVYGDYIEELKLLADALKVEAVIA